MFAHYPRPFGRWRTFPNERVLPMIRQSSATPDGTSAVEADCRGVRQSLRDIPVRVQKTESGGDCAGSEVFALQVLGTDMAPEFNDGDVIIIEPDGLVRDGSYVVAQHDGEWLFRQIRQRGAGWVLVALADGVPERCLLGLEAIRGVVIEKTRPGRRRDRKRYVD